MTDWMLSQHLNSRKRDLSIDRMALVPISPTLLLLKDSMHSASLSDMFHDRCRTLGMDPTFDLLVSRLDSIPESISSDLAVAFGEASSETKMEVRRGEVGDTAVDAKDAFFKCLPRDLVQRFLSSSDCSSATVFASSRVLANQLGSHAAVQYLLCGEALYPDQIVFRPNGMIQTLGVHARLRSSEAVVGLGEGVHGTGGPLTIDLDLTGRRRLPFRLSPNLMRCFSAPVVVGVLGASLGCTLDALVDNKDIVEVREAG